MIKEVDTQCVPVKKEKKFFDVKLIKFLIVGVLNTIVGVSLTWIFINVIPLGHVFEMFPTIVSTTLASIMSYFLNKYFTFKNKEKGIKPIIRFTINIAVCYAVGYGIAYTLFSWIIHLETIYSNIIIPLSKIPFVLSLFPGGADKLVENLVAFCGMCLFVLCNYVGQRFFAFKE